MCDKEQLVAYVYGELDGADRDRMDAHLQTCADCREELAGLRSVRVELAAWTPPQPEFGFHVVRERKPTWQARWMPAFGLAAAAVLLLAVAAAIANLDVTIGGDGLHVRTGRARSDAALASAAPGAPAATTAATPAATPAAAPQAPRLQAAAPQLSADDVRKLYAALDARVRQLETAPRTSAVQAAAIKSAQPSDEVLWQRVRDLLAQSESRQKQELALRIAQVIRDVDAQRIADLNRIQQGLMRIDAITTQEAASHRELANYIVASSRQQQK